MLPDLPRLKKKLQKRLLRQLHELMALRAPLVREIRAHVNSEGDRYSFQTHDTGEIVERNYKTISAKFRLQKAIPVAARTGQIERELENAAAELAYQRERMLFTAVSEAVEQVGNVFDARGRPFHPSMLHEALRKMSVDFDEFGQPVLPTIVLHPDMLKSIASKLKEWEADPQLKAEFNEVIAQKREEWRARESNRKLVG